MHSIPQGWICLDICKYCRTDKSNLLSHPLTVYWHQTNQSQYWPHNARYLPGYSLEYQSKSQEWLSQGRREVIPMSWTVRVYLLTRQEQVTVFRLETGHNHLNHNLYSKPCMGHTEQCPSSTGSQTTEHLLQSYPIYELLRKGIWPDHAPIVRRLYGSLGDLWCIATYIEEIEVSIWQKRRKRRRRTHKVDTSLPNHQGGPGSQTTEQLLQTCQLFEVLKIVARHKWFKGSTTVWRTCITSHCWFHCRDWSFDEWEADKEEKDRGEQGTEGNNKDV